jgi:photosystem II stability/assembly factor-like uncharacterized protein
MKVTRRRAVIAGSVALFLAAFFALGAVSHSTPASSTAAVATGTAGAVPSSQWYWTMAVSPSDPNALVVGSASGLLRSEDGGKSWAPVGPKSFNATSVLQSGNNLIAAGGKLGPTTSAITRTAKGRSAPVGPGLVATSGDGGKTWTVVHPAGLPNISVQSLATGLGSNASTIYAVLTNGKLYSSSDGAKTFKLVSPKLGIPPWAIAATGTGGFVGGDMDTGAYESPNATKWTKTKYKDSRGSVMVMEYAVQPTDSKHVLMSAFGVEGSTDGGKSWHPVLKSSVMFGPVAWASSSPNTAYAVGFDSSVWRTDDGGKTWKKVG